MKNFLSIRVSSKAFLGGLALMAAPVLAAKNYGCDKAATTLKKARSSLNDSQRLSALETLRVEIEDLLKVDSSKTKKPRAYWQTCMDRKRETLDLHMSLSSPSLRSNPDFHKILSRIYEVRGDLKEASHHAETALQSVPGDHAWRLRCLQLWMSSDRNPASTQGAEASFQKRAEAYLKPIIQDPRAPGALVLKALSMRALLLESVARFDDAAQEWEKIIELDPKDIKHRRKLAAWELSRRRLDDAGRHLEAIVQLNSEDLGAQKRLIEIYLSRKDKASARTHLRQALAIYPEDGELLEMWKALGALAG